MTQTTINPYLHCVLVKPIDKEEMDPALVKMKQAIPGFQMPAKEDSNRAKAGSDRGEVVKIGPTAWKDYGVEAPCKIGSIVLFTKHAGTAVEDPNTGEVLLMLTDQDIFGEINNG